MTEKKPVAKPATAKKPQDRQPKKLSVKEVDGGKIVTFKTLKITLKDAAFRDHTIVRTMAKIRKGDLEQADGVILNGEMIDRVLGEAQADKLVKLLADDDGYTDFIALSQAFNEIVMAAYPNS